MMPSDFWHTPFWHVVGEVLAIFVIVSLALLALTEYIGARVPGFYTISEATRRDVAEGDFRLFIGVLMLFFVGGAWWTLHGLWPRI